MRQAYLDLLAKYQKEINDFLIAYAFNQQPLKEALEKLGATKEECVTVLNHGDIVKKENTPKLLEIVI